MNWPAVVLAVPVPLAVLAVLALSAPGVKADDAARPGGEILVLRGGTHCPGIPALSIRLDEGAPALLAAKEYLRLSAASGMHGLDFHPAIPEHIALDVKAGARYAYLATAIRLGWRCKFSLDPIRDPELSRQMVLVTEVPLAIAQGDRKELDATEGQFKLTKP